MHSQYVLSFAPHGDTAGMHLIEVSLPNHGDLRIRARPHVLGGWCAGGRPGALSRLRPR
jgi:hypothetical protein